MSGYDQLEAVGQTIVLVLALRERTDLLWIVAHEGRVDDGCLAQLVVELEDEFAHAPVGLPLDAVGLADLAQVLDGGIHVHMLAHRLRGDVGKRARGPGAAHVHRLPLVGDDLTALLAATDLAGYGLEEPLGKTLHPIEVGVGAVRLHARELGIVGEVHALVAKLTAKLKDTLHPTHDEALERQLGGDAQEEVAVERVEVRHERLGVGTAEDGVHHGGLDLHVAVGLHVAANERNDLASAAEGVAHLGVHDQVHVALAIPNLTIGEPMELLGQWAKALGEDRETRGRDGQLPTARTQDGSRGTDDVAEVELAEKRPVSLAEVVHAAEELNGTRDILEHDEGRLTLVADGANPTGYGDLVIGAFAVGEVDISLFDVGRMGCDLRTDGIGIDSRVDDGLTARATRSPLVDRRGAGVIVGHGSSVSVVGRRDKRTPHLRVADTGRKLTHSHER